MKDFFLLENQIKNHEKLNKNCEIQEKFHPKMENLYEKLIKMIFSPLRSLKIN